MSKPPRSTDNSLRQASRRFTIVICVLAVISGVVCFLLTSANNTLVFLNSPFVSALALCLAIIVFAYPLALLNATASVFRAGIAKATKTNIRFLNKRAIEKAYGLDLIVFDKFGVLTEGKPGIADIIPVASSRPEEAFYKLEASFSATASNQTLKQQDTSGLIKEGFERMLFDLVGNDAAMSQLISNQKDELLTLAAFAQRDSDHPIARAIIAEAKRQALTSVGDEQAGFVSSYSGIVDGKGRETVVGNQRLMAERGIELKHLESIVKGITKVGRLPLYVATGQTIIGIITITDKLRSTSKKSIELLRTMDLETMLLSEDYSQTTTAIASELGIDLTAAEVLPQDRKDIIAAQQTAGKKVALVGNGSDNAAALAQADLAITLTESMTDSETIADIVITNNDLLGIPSAIDLCQMMYFLIRRNRLIALSCNAIGLLLAILALLLSGKLLFVLIALFLCTVIALIVIRISSTRMLGSA